MSQLCQQIHANARHPAAVRLAGLRRLVLTRPGCFTRTRGILPPFAWPASAGWC
jgi:hypothetical protein